MLRLTRYKGTKTKIKFVGDDNKITEFDILFKSIIDENKIELIIDGDLGNFKKYPLNDSLILGDSINFVDEKDNHLSVKYIDNNHKVYNSVSLGFSEPNNFGKFKFQIIRDNAKVKFN